MTLNVKQVKTIIMMRGLGYSQQEIAYIVLCSRKTVQNHLYKVRKEAEKNGINKTFWSYLTIDDLIRTLCVKRRDYNE